MPEGPEEQLEFLRREDIRTMAKDMAHLREEEAKKEREKIIQLQKKQQNQSFTAQEPFRAPLAPSGVVPSGVALRASPPGIDLPKPLSGTKKILVRVVIIFLVIFIAVNIIALIYSFTPLRLWIQKY